MKKSTVVQYRRFVKTKRKLTPTDHETQGLINPFTRHTDKPTGDRHVRAHLGLAVVDQSQHAGVDGVGEK